MSEVLPTVQLRAVLEPDRDEIAALLRVAFGDEGPTVAALVEALHAQDQVLAGFVAVADDLPVGHVQLNRSWLDAPDQLVEVAVLSPLAVAESQRGNGIGARLVDAAVHWAEADGYPAVLLEGDPGYYGRLGFEAAARYGVTPPSVRIPAPACQIRVLSRWRPEYAGALVYCGPFWQLDCVGLRADELRAARRGLT